MTDLPHAPVAEQGPPLGRRPARLVVLLGNKLIGLDSVLPVAMELKAEVPDLAVAFVFLNGQAMPTIRRNYALYEAMRTTGEVAVLSAGDGTISARARAGLRLGHWMGYLAGRPSLLLAPSDLGVFPFTFLARAARLGGGGVCIYCKPACPSNRALNYQLGTQSNGRDLRWRDPGDAFLVYHPLQAGDYAAHSAARTIPLGTSRNFPAWRCYLDRLAAEQGIHDDEGRDLTALPGPRFVVFYPGPVVIPHQSDDVRQSFLALLDLLTEEAPHATVIVKPHPICDLDLLRRDIAARAAPDIRISHAHPQLLLRLATVAISTNGSNVMNDCYIEGVPVIETSRYKPDILARGDSLFPNRGRLGCPDMTSLRAAIRLAATAPERLPKPDCADLTWPKPPALAAALWGG
jgi:hypothetical protein